MGWAVAVGLRAGCQSLNGRVHSQEGTWSGDLEPIEQDEWASTQRHQWQESEPDCNGCFVVMEEIVLVCGRCTLSYPDLYLSWKANMLGRCVNKLFSNGLRFKK